MSRRHVILVIAVMALVLLNVWRWWPEGESIVGVSDDAGVGSYRVEDFKIFLDIKDKEVIRVKRNLFRPKVRITKRKSIRTKKSIAKSPPRKTKAELEREAAQAELAQYKLVGIIFRDKRGRAFLAKGDENFMVYAGDKAGRFLVKKITTDAIELMDPKTQVSGTIPVSGK